MADPTLGTAVLRTKLDTAGLTTGLRNAQQSVEQSSVIMAARLQTIGAGLTNVGRTLTTGLTLPVVAAGTAIVKVAGDFERSLNRVAALSGATGESFELLRNQARQLGATTQFSASQAADAMGFLAQAGFDAGQIFKALPATLNLAGAAQLDLGRSADIVSNILTGFQLPVSELDRAVDVLTKTFTSANTDLSQLGEAFKFVGPVASAAGQGFEDTAAALGLLSNAGLQASVAGTGLRQILISLSQEQEVFGVATRDVQGALRPLADILADAEGGVVGLEEAIEVFGIRGGPAFLALLGQGSGALRGLTQELNTAEGTAARIQAIQLQGLVGQITALKSASEGLAIAFGDTGLLGGVTNLVAGLTGLVRKFTELSPASQRTIITVAAVGAAIGPVVLVVGRLVSAYGALIAVLPRVVAGLTAFRAATLTLIASNTALQAGLVATRAVMTTLFGPVGIVAGGVVALTALAAAFARTTNAINQFANQGIQVNGLSQEAAGIQQAILDLEDAKRDFVLRQANRIADGEINLEQARAAVQRYDAQIQALRDRFGEVVRATAAVRDGVANVPDIDIAVNVEGVSELQALLGSFGGGVGTVDVAGGSVATIESLFRDLAESGTRSVQIAQRLVASGVDEATAQENNLRTRIALLEDTRGVLLRDFYDSVTDAQLTYLESTIAARKAELDALLDQAVAEAATPRTQVLPAGVAAAAAVAGLSAADREQAAVIAADTRAAQAAVDAAARAERVAFWLERANANAENTAAAAAIQADTQTALAAAAERESAARFAAALAQIDINAELQRQAAEIRADTQAALADDSLRAQARLAAITPVVTVSVASEEDLRARVFANQEIERSAGAASRGLGLLAARAEQVADRAARGDRVVALDGFAPAVSVQPAISVAPLSGGQIAAQQADIGSRLAEFRAEAAAASAAAAAEQQRAADAFAGTVVTAGLQFASSLAESIRSGDVRGAFQALTQGASSIVGAGSFGALSILGGAVPIAGVAAGVIGLIGGLIGSLLPSGRQTEEREARQRAAGARTVGAPSVSFNLTVTQSLNLQSLTDSASRAAVNGLLEQTVGTIQRAVESVILPRIERLEARLA